MLAPTLKLYWQDDHCHHATATIIAIDGDRLALDQTCFYPGGGGQPADTGTITCGKTTHQVLNVAADEHHVIWHHITPALPQETLGAKVALALDSPRRDALARYHTVLHVLNTIALRDYNAWITGAQIGTDYSRIDFKVEGFSQQLATELEARVNAVLTAGHPLRAFYLSEAEFATRPDLLRTLEVKPPVIDGRVRVVAIEGFDEQACGGTHVATTAELGRFEIYKLENKGRINKRLYVRLIANA